MSTATSEEGLVLKSNPGLKIRTKFRLTDVPMGMGKIKKKKGGPEGPRKIIFPVEKDPKKLISFVCGSNILKEGGQDVEIKPDSEYPDWLWTIRLGPPPPLEEMDPNTKQYWRRLRAMKIGDVNRLNSLRSWHKTTK
ncbi:39S ribosomal protein L54, mitochondrial isoform X2 [Chelonus insularis]|uniref:39S ribosomal protein L54, mitochondrial isoform X2 n=1 Tax=Chelonus insularis TaxID=460826 RepID=UPI00158CC77D|nr:39S ribosomal protein L54, mitochondrial isoform X2 [Chelonus insularis]